jgi:preprotein translocase subunit SecG
MTEGRKRVTAILVTTLAFTGLMFSWAVSSPPGSDPDESFHYGLIWCLRDSPKQGCINSNATVRDPRQVEIALWNQMCYRDELYRSAKCGIGEGRLTVEVDENLYPQPFYFMMNKLAVGGMSTGTIIMRTFHGLLAAFFLVTALMLSRRENRRVTSRQQWPLAKEVFRNATFSVLELTT